MNFQVKIQDNWRKNKFRDKQRTNNVPMMFLHVKILMESKQLRFLKLPIKEEGAAYVFSVSKPENTK